MRRLGTVSIAGAVALSCAAVAGAAPHGGAQADAPAPARWWDPPGDVRTMLGEVDPANLERYDRTLAGFGTRHTLSTQTDPQRGIGAARDWIRSEFEKSAATSQGRMTVSLQSYVQKKADRVPRPTRITNVVARLEGTDRTARDRVYVVGAHYDSRRTDVMDAEGDAPGADDDASGVSAILELARVMAPRPTEATIVFVAYAGEEQGLYGSNHFAAVAERQKQNIQGVFNMDIVGSSLGGNGVRRAHQIRLFSEGVPTSETPEQTALREALGGENDGPSRQFARFIKETGENSATDMRVKLVYRRDRFLRGGDQIPYLERGWTAVRFSEPNENFDHQHQDVRMEDGRQIGDLPQFVDFRYLARVTRLIGSSLAAAARAPRAPRGAQIVATDLSYDTELRWRANPERDVAGYEVVWRDSTEPLWTHARRIGKVTRYTIRNLNKDDNQVGVRAIDRDGNRSPVAYPVPAT